MEDTMRKRLIAALDVKTRQAALDIASKLSGVVDFFKVGLQLFIEAGPSFIKELKTGGCRVFLDLKLHDIPNTVARAVESAAKLEVDFLTIHAAGGNEMLKAAVKAASAVNNNQTPLKIIAVTLLTSITELQLQKELGVTRSLISQVEALALMAKDAGCHGLVASPLEIKQLRAKVGRSTLLVTPGIRPLSNSLETQNDDQARIATPKEAILQGADYLVVGRPILEAPDPKEAALSIIEEMESAYAKR